MNVFPKYGLAILALLLPVGLAAQSNDSLLVWPGPPDPARIRHIRTISSMGDFKHEKGFFAKLVSFLTGGESTLPWLVQPVGIAVSADGRIFVADPGAHGIHVINPEKKEYDFVKETKYGMLISPVGLALTEDGRLYVSDSERGDVIVLDDDLEAEAQIKGSLVRPTGLQIIGGKLYVVDTGRHEVVVFDLKGNVMLEFGRHGAGAGEFNYPIHLAGRDSVYVVDALNYRIQKFDPAGKFGSAFGDRGDIPGRFASPKSIALDSQGHVYVTDALMDNFQIFTAYGQLLLIVGRKGASDGEFMSPGGIAIDRNDRVYVVDTLNKRVQIFQFIK